MQTSHRRVQPAQIVQNAGGSRSKAGHIRRRQPNAAQIRGFERYSTASHHPRFWARGRTATVARAMRY
jgi:hypothetical protein